MKKKLFVCLQYTTVNFGRNKNYYCIKTFDLLLYLTVRPNN